MTVERLLNEMSAEEFEGWMQFFALEPWGYDVDNLRTGIVAAQVHNSSGHAKRAARPRDFFPLRRIDAGMAKDKAYWDATKDAWRGFSRRQKDRAKPKRGK